MPVATIAVPPDLDHPGQIVVQSRWRDYQGALRRVGLRLGELGVTDPARYTAQGQIGRADDERAVLSWMFQYQPMHLTSSVALSDWFLDRVDLSGGGLRVLSLGSGPATEALALHVAARSRDLDYLGVDYNPHMLGLGRQVLDQVRALRPEGTTEASLVQSTDHPAVADHLRRGAQTGRPLLVSLSHILNQCNLDDATLHSWARAVATGLGEEGGWLLAQEPASYRFGDGRLPGLRSALAAAGVRLSGDPAETSSWRAHTWLDRLLHPERSRQPWLTWSAESKPLWVLAARLERT